MASKRFHLGQKKKIRREIVTVDGYHGITGLVGSCFQVTRELAAFVVNVRCFGKQTCDFELGNDIYLFDSFETLGESEPLTFLRSFTDRHPDDGSEVVFSRYDGQVAFVPVGATLPDGTPHPHAGTGFCLGTAIALPANAQGAASVDVYRGNLGWFLILTQLAWQDDTLIQTNRQILRPTDFMPGANDSGLGAPVFDGADILIPFSMVKPAPYGLGLLRMQRLADGQWHPGTFEMIAPEKGDNPPLFSKPTPGDGLSGCEGSAARLADGQVVFTCREWGPKPWSPEPLEASRMRLWKGCPGVTPFRQVQERAFFHTLSPITVGATWEGEPYLLANAYSRTDWKGAAVPSLDIREKLLLYPLAGENLAPAEPLLLCDVVNDFGEPGPETGGWFADHPMGWRLQLQGKQRNFVTWRVFHVRETKGVTPSEFSAAWIAEIFSDAVGVTTAPSPSRCPTPAQMQ